MIETGSWATEIAAINISWCSGTHDLPVGPGLEVFKSGHYALEIYAHLMKRVWVLGNQLTRRTLPSESGDSSADVITPVPKESEQPYVGISAEKQTNVNAEEMYEQGHWMHPNESHNPTLWSLQPRNRRFLFQTPKQGNCGLANRSRLYP